MAVATVACPKCNAKIKARDELEGKRIKCPSCGAAFIVPSLARDKADSPRPKPAGQAKSSQDEFDEDGNPYGVETPDLAPRCPNCANELTSADALICLYCGYNTQTRAGGKTKRVFELTFFDRLKWLSLSILCGLGIISLYLLYMWYIFYLPGQTRDSWLDLFNHEALRLWIGMMCLGVVWGLGNYAYKRLILQPVPPEVEKD